MATMRTETGQAAPRGTAARTGEQFLAGLASGEREIWLNGEKITHPLDHPDLEAAARSMGRVFDLQHEHASEMLVPSPDDGRLVNVTHVIPRSRGGRKTWENGVAHSATCNLRKGGRLPKQAGMYPHRWPHVPTVRELQENGRAFPPRHLHETWRDYLYWDTELEP